MGKKKYRARKGRKQSKDIIQEGRDEEPEKKKKTRRGLRFSKTQWNEKALGQTHSKRDGRKSDDDQTASPVKRKEADGFKAHRPLHTPHAPTDDWGPQRPQSDVVVSEPQTAAKSFTATPGFQGSDQGGETPFVQTVGTTFDFQGYSNTGESEFEAVLPVGLSGHEDADMGSGHSQWEISQKAAPLLPESAPFITGETEVAPMRIGRIELTRNAGKAERKREKQRAKREVKQTERHAALLNTIRSVRAQDHEMPLGEVPYREGFSAQTPEVGRRVRPVYTGIRSGLTERERVQLVFERQEQERTAALNMIRQNMMRQQRSGMTEWKGYSRQS
uniref:Uncharacterized protein n=1 Tax=Chromera velia CCMP2878 TaxID=1169474 RepID=A0A0G4HMW9_9ALVE|eukprot:Cvel_29431.t1-p1 / transcript=Cvel_29431.t1 / gene=Cvel_29431 / organism=Chromera_velia_CCMP2878 / gene_product=hypothetical protein / transcript_product=hypothetical protein / location=Cvel_scaffold4021:33-1025(+) / protein_length=331 / sequence_SO=supercontig / SO=protein_coding / is_pseudo=false